jgi:hypothetical protein
VGQGRAYVSSQAGQGKAAGVHLFDLADPNTTLPREFHRVDAVGVLVEGRYLELGKRGRTVWRIDPVGARQAEPSAPPPPAPPPPEARPGFLGRVANLFVRAAAEMSAGTPPAPVYGSPAPQLAHQVVELPYEAARVRSAAEHGGHLYVGLTQGMVAVYALSQAGRLTSSTSWYVGPGPLVAVAGDALHVISQYSAWKTYSIAHPARPAELGVPPSERTIEYLKRRARRLLRRMAKTDPDRFVETAFHTLALAGSTGKAPDLRYQWVSVDLLYGGSDRYRQIRHGRGPYREREPRRGSLRRTREERAPEAWDRRPDLAAQLYAQPGLAWPTYEAMLKVLQGNDAPVPASSPEVRLQFLRSPSPLLQHVAVAATVAEIEAGEKPGGELSARAFYYSSAAVRTRTLPLLLPRAGSPNWARPFAGTLTELVAAGCDGEVIPRRVVAAAALLAQSFVPFITSDLLLPIAGRLGASPHPELVQLLLAAFRAVTPGSLLGWLSVWAQLPVERLEPAWQALVAGLRRAKLSQQTALALVTAEDASVREAGWRLLQALNAEQKLLAVVWEAVLAAPGEAPALRTALGSGIALELLGRSGLDVNRLAERVAGTPSLAALLSAEAMEVVAASVPVAGLFPLIQVLSDAQWASVKGSVLAGLRRAGKMSAFWKAVPAALTDAALQDRLLDDYTVAASLLLVDDPGVLEITDAPFETLLHEWLLIHLAQLPRGSGGLLTAATHPLPRVREPALARAREEGIDLPFALKLLESGVPASVELGRGFFEAVEPGAEAELSYALALCDSPERSTRALGRAFIGLRIASLPRPELVRALAEHGDAEMNRFVADLLLELGPGDTAAPEEVREFDRGVLRGRNRGRRAKEQVKSRLSRSGAADVPLLLDLARSGTPRDAEWALGELARLAVAGQPIEGIEVEGVAGV